MWQSKIRTFTYKGLESRGLDFATDDIDRLVEQFLNDEGIDGWEPYAAIEGPTTKSDWYIQLYLKRWLPDDE